jgi:hypothetical protein
MFIRFFSVSFVPSVVDYSLNLKEEKQALCRHSRGLLVWNPKAFKSKDFEPQSAQRKGYLRIAFFICEN